MGGGRPSLKILTLIGSEQTYPFPTSQTPSVTVTVKILSNCPYVTDNILPPFHFRIQVNQRCHPEHVSSTLLRNLEHKITTL